MNIDHLKKKFATMGSRLKVRRQGPAGRPWQRVREFSIDIARDRKGEYFDLTLKSGPVPAEEKDLRAKLAKLGIGTEAGFDADKLSPEIRKAVTAG